MYIYVENDGDAKYITEYKNVNIIQCNETGPIIRSYRFFQTIYL